MKAAGAYGTLEQLRVVVYLALTSGSDPLTLLPEITENTSDHVTDTDRDTNRDAGGDGWPWSEPDEAENQRPEDEDSEDDEDEGPAGGARKGPEGPEGPKGGLGGQDAPVQAVINLLVPAGTLFGWSSAPGEIPGYGAVDPETIQDLVQTASAHPKTRWCVTVIDPVTKEGLAHGCAPGQHRWNPNMYRTGGGDRDGPEAPRDGEPDPGSEPDQQAAGKFLASLRMKLARIAKDETRCDHQECTGKYQVPDKLKHLIRARRATCVAPCCNRSAAEGDADHTIAWPEGPTCQENLGGACRYHHRCKQDSEWTLEQPDPGIFRWRRPSGRTSTTRPSRYLI